MKLQHMAIKWNNKIILINESYTSKTCCICHNIKNNLCSNKVYTCSKYNLIIDIFKKLKISFDYKEISTFANGKK